jgi:type IV pilus assembly protein PilC
VGNSVYQDIILKVKEEVKKGEAISSVLKYHPDVISPFFIQMVVVGEKTGHLDSALLNLVDFYQKDVDRALENFIKLIEPILIISLGIIVGIFMAAILIPIYQRMTLGF